MESGFLAGDLVDEAGIDLVFAGGDSDQVGQFRRSDWSAIESRGPRHGNGHSVHNGGPGVPPGELLARQRCALLGERGLHGSPNASLLRGGLLTSQR